MKRRKEEERRVERRKNALSKKINFNVVNGCLLLAIVVALMWSLLLGGGRNENERARIAIVVVAYNRPEYFKRVLDSLSNCESIEMYDVYFFLEPGNAEVLRLAWAFDASRRRIVKRNPQRLGAHKNKKRAMSFGFEVADFVIMIEDDTTLSPDALRFFQFARDQYESDQNVFTVSAYADNCRQEDSTVPSIYHHTIARRRHYTPWVWGTWKDRWISDLKDQWDGWDVQMNFRTPLYDDMVSGRTSEGPDFSRFDAGLRGDRVEVFPVLSRSNNIGDENGMHAEYGVSNFLYEDAGVLDKSALDHSFKETFDHQKLCHQVSFGPDTLRGMCS